MIKQRRTFAPEFKREAACLVLGQGYSHPEAARSLGADSTPFGHSAHADPDTCSTLIRTGSRSAATQGWHC